MKRLRKSRDRMLAGVASGLADYLQVDPTLIRAGFLVAFLGFGTGLLAYIALAIVMPDPTA